MGVMRATVLVLGCAPVGLVPARVGLLERQPLLRIAPRLKISHFRDSGLQDCPISRNSSCWLCNEIAQQLLQSMSCAPNTRPQNPPPPPHTHTTETPPLVCRGGHRLEQFSAGLYISGKLQGSRAGLGSGSCLAACRNSPGCGLLAVCWAQAGVLPKVSPRPWEYPVHLQGPMRWLRFLCPGSAHLDRGELQYVATSENSSGE